MNLDKYFEKVYNESKYNCAHFVCEIWLELFKQDISFALDGALRGPRQRKLDAHTLNVFERLEAPSGPCLALFQLRRKAPHVGIFLDGKILHITQKGVEWNCLEVLMLSFNQVRFYSVKKSYNS